MIYFKCPYLDTEMQKRINKATEKIEQMEPEY